MMEKLKNSAKTQLINIAFNAFLETQFLKASDVWLTLKKKRRYNTNLSSRCIHRCIYIKDNTIRGISIHTCLLTLYLFLLGFTENIRHLIWRLVTVTLICNMCDSHSPSFPTSSFATLRQLLQSTDTFLMNLSSLQRWVCNRFTCISFHTQFVFVKLKK